MPYRGRDTHYLESFFALISLSMGVMCLVYARRSMSLSFMDSKSVPIPVWFWGVLWMVSGVLLAYGLISKRFRISEYGALYTAVLWAVVFYAAITAGILFPLSTAVSPAFTLYSLRIYVYKTRVERAHQRWPTLRTLARSMGSSKSSLESSAGLD